jgi:hypothetical protein
MIASELAVTYSAAAAEQHEGAVVDAVIDQAGW